MANNPPEPELLKRSKTWAPGLSIFEEDPVASSFGDPAPPPHKWPSTFDSDDVPVVVPGPQVASSLGDPALPQWRTWDYYDNDGPQVGDGLSQGAHPTLLPSGDIGGPLPLPLPLPFPLAQAPALGDVITPAQEYENMSMQHMAQAQSLESEAQRRRDMAQMRKYEQDRHELFPFPGGHNPMMVMLPCPWPQACGMLMPPMMAPSQGASKGPSSSLDAVGSSAGKTTVMWKNLPNNYTRDDLLDLMKQQGFEGAFDFFYSPVDFKDEALLGYAFVNFKSAEDADRFYDVFEGFTAWTLALTSAKISQVTWSKEQGLECHIEKYRHSPVMHESKPEAYKPVFMQDGKKTAFPEPTKKIRAPHQKDCRPKA